jgi:hypothetical protein
MDAATAVEAMKAIANLFEQNIISVEEARQALMNVCFFEWRTILDCGRK